MRPSRKGISIPAVVLFCSFLVVFVIAFVQTRVNMKYQTRLTFEQVKATYMAQAGIQHALLKLLLLPNVSYEAGLYSFGVCPFVPRGVSISSTSGVKSNRLLEEFRRDIRTDNDTLAGNDYRLRFTDPEYQGWSYTALSVKAIMGTSDDIKREQVVEIGVEGTARSNVAGKMLDTTDNVTRMVKITRAR